jgi:hypothetical protein
MKLSEEIRSWETFGDTPANQQCWADRVAELEDLLAQADRDRARLGGRVSELESGLHVARAALITIRDGGSNPVLAREAYEEWHQHREYESASECSFGGSGECGLDRSVVCRIGAKEPPEDCPLRTKAVLERLQHLAGGAKCEELIVTTFRTELWSSPSDMKGRWGPVKLRPNTCYRVTFVRGVPCDD